MLTGDRGAFHTAALTVVPEVRALLLKYVIDLGPDPRPQLSHL